MRLLVRFRSEATPAERDAAVRSVGGWIDAEIPQLGIVRIALPGGTDDAVGDGPAVAAFLARDPAVASAEHDSSLRLDLTPNDQYYANDPYTPGLGEWGIRKALIDKAWDVVRGSPNVTVAVLDTGVDPDHPDLAGALVPGSIFVSQPSSECAAGTTRDDNSHGTHVAGIIGANGNDGIGVAGAAFGVKVMPLKVLDCTGVGSLSDVSTAMVYAADHGARVVNLSLGSPFDGATLRSAVEYATRKNVLIVSAVGNCGAGGERCTSVNEVEYPAAYPEVVGVGATDIDDAITFFSTRNSTVSVVAPGRRIVSTTPRYQTYLSRKATDPTTLNYAAFSGTSQASPFVAAVAALVWSADPSLTAAQVRDRLTASADDLGAPGRDDTFGYGRVNAQRAVVAATERYAVTYDGSALPTSVATGQAFAARVVLTNASTFTWSAAGATPVRLQWSWLDATGAPVPQLQGQIAIPADLPSGASATVAGNISAPASAGRFVLSLDLLRGDVSFSSKGAAPFTRAVAVGSGFGATYAAAAATASFDVGVAGQIAVALTNTGTAAWSAAGATPVHLSYHWLRAGSVIQWDGARAAFPADVPSGARTTLALPVTPPSDPGTYTLRIELVREGVGWFSDFGVTPFDVTANVRSGLVATYALAAAPLPVLLPGGRTQLALRLTNSGTQPWPADGAQPVRLAAHLTNARGEVVIWDGARTSLQADVAPGASVQTTAILDAPVAPGPYRARIDLVREGVAWFGALGVPTADLDLLVAPDYRATLPTGPVTVLPGNAATQVSIRNDGIATWATAGSAPVNVALHWYGASGNVLVWDGPRTALPGVVAPGASVTLAVALGPVPQGAAFVTIDLVSEGVRWFDAGQRRPVTLTP